MPKYQYLVEIIGMDHYSSALNHYGEQGWSLVATHRPVTALGHEVGTIELTFQRVSDGPVSTSGRPYQFTDVTMDQNPAETGRRGRFARWS